MDGMAKEDRILTQEILRWLYVEVEETGVDVQRKSYFQFFEAFVKCD